MPNRIIKESICYSDDLDQLTPFEEVVFYRLIVNVDDYGRIDARPAFLKSKLFVTKQGVTEKNIEGAVARLASVGLVRLYEVDGKSFLLFPKWHLHQRVRNSKEKYPAPNDDFDSSPQLAATCRKSRPESNPIRIQSESKSESESESNAHARADVVDADYGEVFALFEQCGFEITAFMAEELSVLVEKYSKLWVMEAIKRAAEHGAKKLSYIKAILNNWQIAGAMDSEKPAPKKLSAEGREAENYDLPY